MSVTLWVHTLEGRKLTSHHDDHSLMFKFASALDVICTRIQVRPLSSFHDFTEAKASMSEDDNVSDKLDPETGWGYGIDDMTWFPATDGLATLSALRARLSTGDTEGIPSAKIPDLIAELDSCIAKLSGPASQGARFHLALVM